MTGEGPIPLRLRPGVRQALDELVAGERPDLLIWVRRYGTDGATLVRQPEEIWDHPDATLAERDDGTAWGVVPLWTTTESPSDLSAEFEVDAAGEVSIHDVHVL